MDSEHVRRAEQDVRLGVNDSSLEHVKVPPHGRDGIQKPPAVLSWLYWVLRFSLLGAFLGLMVIGMVRGLVGGGVDAVMFCYISPALGALVGALAGSVGWLNSRLLS